MNATRINTRKQLTTPPAAAIAGIVFGVLFFTAEALIHLALPGESGAAPVRFDDQQAVISFALNLVPFGGIAFLWFIGVARDRLGAHEDQLFATVFLGSGLLYLAMTFVATALAGGLLAEYGRGTTAPSDALSFFSRQTMYQITSVFGVRMAAVFMLSSATMWTRTGVMARWLALLTYVLGVTLLVLGSVNSWVTLVFPGWVLLVSVLILVQNLRRRTNPASQTSAL